MSVVRSVSSTLFEARYAQCATCQVASKRSHARTLTPAEVRVVRYGLWKEEVGVHLGALDDVCYFGDLRAVDWRNQE